MGLGRVMDPSCGPWPSKHAITSHRISNEEAKKLLLGEKEPSMQFTTPEELGELAVFFCSPAAANVRGVAWNMDGGWAAQ